MFNYFINYINDNYIKNIKEKNIRYLNFKNFTFNKIKNNKDFSIVIKDNIYYKDCKELKNFITVLNINKDLKYNLYYKENTNECYYEVYIKKN